jgi:Helicase HerA, central domain
MMAALVILGAGLLVFGLILAARYLDVLAWQRSLVAFRVIPPTDLTIEQVTSWLTLVAASTHPPYLSLLPLPPVAIEITATAQGITHYVLATERAKGKLLAGLRSGLPGARLEETPDYLVRGGRWRLAAEAVMTSHVRPLATERAESAGNALLAALQPVPYGSEVCYQLIVTSAGTPSRIPTPRSSAQTNNLTWWEGALPKDAEAVQAARTKQREVLLRGVLRVGVSAASLKQAEALMGRVWPVLHTSNAPSVRIRRRYLLSSVVAGRLGRRDYPITRWPLLINAAETAAFVALPVGKVRLPGLPLGTARQLPPAPSMPRRGLVLAESNYPGMTAQPLALKTVDRLRHMYVLGPTGSGKSWLLTRMILQDIAAGYGLFVVDPKGDLVTDVLARVRDADRERVVTLDVSRRERPIGFNVLADTRSEEARELTVDAVLQVFKEIWAPFWGPRSDQIMRAGLSTLVHTRGVDGSAMTLCELVPLLTQPAFRRFVVNQSGLPDSVRVFWHMFGAWADAGTAQAINPILNKVEAFTGRTPIRLLLGQSKGLNLSSVFRERRVVLVSLAKGTLGTETANLLGALLVSSLWQATLARVRVPAEKRQPAFAYIDEAADIMRLPLPLADMLAQARGLGLGVIAATQLIAQVPNPIKAALLGTVRTQAVFAVEYDDATVLARRFTPLSAEELTNLGPYEIALRPCVNGVTIAPVTGVTLPLEVPSREADELAALSRERFGRPRAEVEAAIAARQTVTTSLTRRGFGRQTGGQP